MDVGVLIYFIHHVSLSFQANEIAARIGTELIEGVDRLFPEHVGRRAPRIPKEPLHATFIDAFEREACPVGATGDGYLQFIDTDTLMALASREDLIVRLERRPGHYVIADCPLVLVWPENRVTDKTRETTNTAFSLDHQRTSGQDVEFTVNQLVEIAMRALSPSLNDPFTAIACIKHPGSALCRLAQQEMPSPYRHDTQDALRVIVPAVTFPDITDAAFNQIRQYGRSSTAVTIRLLAVIGAIASFAHRPEDCAALLRHAEMIARGARDGLPEEEDRQSAGTVSCNVQARTVLR
ncbi:MAG: DUF2254 domain-containing protein [Desulfoarculaceae bacterium]|nr:DUF2254 domain-containing protein [Desulfoarculaceae bacterium]